MTLDSKSLCLKILIVVMFVTMIVVNALSALLPINGQTPGEISDSLPNLFAPAGITFSIWSVIYFLLALHVLYQLGLFQKDKKHVKLDLLYRVGVCFVVSCLANISWVFAWHYRIFILSLLLIIVILYTLIMINEATHSVEMTTSEKFFIRLPFSIYFGWITVATIANFTSFLVSIGWSKFGISEPTWTIIILFVGITIGILTMLNHKDYAYGLVLIWAYLGILIKHISVNGFDNKYPAVIISIIICLVALCIAEISVYFYKKKLKL